MDDLKLPAWNVPPQRNPKMSMDEYLEFVLFCLKTFPPKKDAYRDEPAPVRFVIREEDASYFSKDSEKGEKK